MGVGFLIAGALLLAGYVAGSRNTVLGPGWAIPAVAAALVFVEPTSAGLREVSRLLAMLGAATAIAWPVVIRGHVAANRFGERFW